MIFFKLFRILILYILYIYIENKITELEIKGYHNGDKKFSNYMYSTHGIAIKNIEGKKYIFDNAKSNRKEISNIHCIIDSLVDIFYVYEFFLK